MVVVVVVVRGGGGGCCRGVGGDVDVSIESLVGLMAGFCARSCQPGLLAKLPHLPESGVSSWSFLLSPFVRY